ncbi:phosphodiester glycosidase family protein [Haloferula sp.]|uniref:phosphodiester glycosidase family protein n=1 Tax=Haloferula sp. TaxID=2497595 RepID=UPI00329CC39B
MMRILLLLTIVLASCAGPQPDSTVELPPAAPSEALEGSDSNLEPQTQADPPITPLSKGPVNPPRFVKTSLAGISIEAITFDSRSHFLAVADQAQGPGSIWPDCRAAGQSTGGIAAINAGFFTPEGKPLGKVITNGKSTGEINRASSLGSGFYIRSSSGTMDLIRREKFNSARQALQSGPFLVENGSAVGGLSDKQSSARSIVAYDGRSQWVIARTGACSLSQLARALQGNSIGDTTLQQVLNLDGGRSSEFWASDKVSGGPHFERPFWNKAVRNFLVVRSR